MEEDREYNQNYDNYVIPNDYVDGGEWYDSFDNAFTGSTDELFQYFKLCASKTSGTDPLYLVNVPDQTGATYLFWAAAGGQEDTVKRLLESGADPNICNHANESPLHMAAEIAHVGIVKLLLAHNANPNACTNNYEDTVLHYGSHNQEIVNLLLEAGATVEVNKEGFKWDEWDAYVNLCKSVDLKELFEPNLHCTAFKLRNYLDCGLGYFPEDQWAVISQPCWSANAFARAHTVLPQLNALLADGELSMNDKTLHTTFPMATTPETDSPPTTAYYLRELKNLTGFHHPKPFPHPKYSTEKSKQFAFFGTNLSPVQIWKLSVQGKFYIPNFIRATTSTKNHWKIPGNVLVRISGWNNFSTLLSKSICLFSCYNIFRFHGIHKAEEVEDDNIEEEEMDEEEKKLRAERKGRMVMHLEVLDYYQHHKPEAPLDPEHEVVPDSTTTSTTETETTATTTRSVKSLTDLPQFEKLLDSNLPCIDFEKCVQDILSSFPTKVASAPEEAAKQENKDAALLSILVPHGSVEPHIALASAKGNFATAVSLCMGSI